MVTIDKYTNQIKMTRGDCVSLKVNINQVNNEPYKLQEDDIVTFTARKTIDSDAVIYIVADREGYISIYHDTTSDLEYGYYLYDVQLETSEGEVYTIIPLSTIELLQEVTR